MNDGPRSGSLALVHLKRACLRRMPALMARPNPRTQYLAISGVAPYRSVIVAMAGFWVALRSRIWRSLGESNPCFSLERAAS
jgi:hypothetical protein